MVVLTMIEDHYKATDKINLLTNKYKIIIQILNKYGC